jgi:hypothetical protein
MADLWRTSIMMENPALAGEGGGCTPTPFHSIYVPSHTMVQCTLQRRGQKHSSHLISILYSICSSESGDLQSVKAPQYMVSNTTQHPSTLPRPLHIVCLMRLLMRRVQL